MASKKTKRPRTKRQKARHQAYQYGPFRVERSGRFIKSSSALTGEEFAEHRQRINAQQPVIRKQITDAVEKLLTVLKSVDPLHLLSGISMQHCFVVPELYRESTDEHRLEYAEYAQSLALSISNPTLNGGLTSEQYSDFESTIAGLYDDLRWYFGAEIAEKASGMHEAELRFKAIASFLVMRGEAFPEHMREHFTAIFSPHDAFLKSRFGVTSRDVLVAVDAICEQVTERLIRQPLFKAIEELHTIAVSHMQAAPIKSDHCCPGPYFCRRDNLPSIIGLGIV